MREVGAVSRSRAGFIIVTVYCAGMPASLMTFA